MIAEAALAECVICGFKTSRASELEAWDFYGECVGPNHPDGGVQHSRWLTHRVGEVVEIQVNADGERSEVRFP